MSVSLAWQTVFYHQSSSMTTCFCVSETSPVSGLRLVFIMSSGSQPALCLPVVLFHCSLQGLSVWDVDVVLLSDVWLHVSTSSLRRWIWSMESPLLVMLPAAVTLPQCFRISSSIPPPSHRGPVGALTLSQQKRLDGQNLVHRLDQRFEGFRPPQLSPWDHHLFPSYPRTLLLHPYHLTSAYLLHPSSHFLLDQVPPLFPWLCCSGLLEWCLSLLSQLQQPGSHLVHCLLCPPLPPSPHWAPPSLRLLMGSFNHLQRWHLSSSQTFWQV